MKVRKKEQAPEVPSPNGPLSSSLLPAIIKDANVAVKQCTHLSATKLRGMHVKFIPKNQAAIAKYMYAFLHVHGNKATVCHFLKELICDGPVGMC